MLNTMKAMYFESQFLFNGGRGLLAIFTNPFYFVRKHLYANIKIQAPLFAGDVLDFGCGSKPYKSLFTNCKSYIGCDVEISGHEHRNEIIDVFYDGKKIPFKDGQFDCILSSETFEHIFNLNEIVAELNRVLKLNGKMLLTVPFVWNEHEVPYDCARYTIFGLKNILEKNGFEVIEFKKSTPYIETVFQMAIEYIRLKVQNKLSNIYFWIIFNAVCIAPLVILGIVLSKILPDDESLYADNIILCKKNANI